MKIVKKEEFRSHAVKVNESPDMVRLTIDATPIETRELERQIQDMKPEGTKSYAVYVVDNRSTKYIVDAEDINDAQAQIEIMDSGDLEDQGKIVSSDWYVDEVREI